MFRGLLQDKTIWGCLPMEVFNLLKEMGHEEVVFCHDPDVGLKGIIAVHSTVLGPALGGCRMWNYGSEEEALWDVLRLSEGMTYKNAAMDLPLGGGKAVIIADPRLEEKRDELFRAFGRFVDSLGGKYITAEDVGVSPADMAHVAAKTNHVAGLEGRSGDPSPITAYGVYRGIRAAVGWTFGSEELEGKTVAIQGLGHVGIELARLLAGAGAQLVVTDIFSDRTREAQERFGAQVVEPEDIYAVDCDIFAPCALGSVINQSTIDKLRCKIVAGAANNQLLDNSFAAKLAQRGILYAPDYVINGGGVINVYLEVSGTSYSREKALEKVEIIPRRLGEIFRLTAEKGITTAEAAKQIVEAKLEKERFASV